uniref:Uncharacterized protein n=1 Tax=Setaria italica TaxID=4555 RepID=K4AHI1_SETIT
MTSSLQDQGWKQVELWKDIKIHPYPEAIDVQVSHASKNKFSEHQRRLGDEVGHEMTKRRPRPITLDWGVSSPPRLPI